MEQIEWQKLYTGATQRMGGGYIRTYNNSGRETSYLGTGSDNSGQLRIYDKQGETRSYIGDGYLQAYNQFGERTSYSQIPMSHHCPNSPDKLCHCWNYQISRIGQNGLDLLPRLGRAGRDTFLSLRTFINGNLTISKQQLRYYLTDKLRNQFLIRIANTSQKNLENIPLLNLKLKAQKRLANPSKKILS